MPDGLKSQYISYPFMQVASRPDWFRDVKDARIVVTLPAGKLDTDTNGDNIQAILTDMSEAYAIVEVTCCPLEGTTASVPIYRESDVPTTQSFFLVGDDFDLTEEREYGHRIHPDCLTLLQTAPSITGYTTGVLKLYNGNNITVSKTASGALIYGVEGGGTGLYKQEVEDTYIKGLGLRSINGMSGDVWIKGSYPVRVEDIYHNGRLTLTVTTDEVSE